jgi:hypothetical protein
MDLLVLRELCEEYRRILADLLKTTTLARRHELESELRVTGRSICQQVRGSGRQFWQGKT